MLSFKIGEQCYFLEMIFSSPVKDKDSLGARTLYCLTHNIQKKGAHLLKAQYLCACSLCVCVYVKKASLQYIFMMI